MRKLYVKILWLMWLWVCFHCRLTQSRYLILKFQTWNKLLNNISWNHNIYWRNLGSLYYEVAVFDSIYAKLSMSLIPFPQSLGLLYIYIYIYLIACIKCSGSLFDVSNKTLYITVWEVSAVCFLKGSYIMQYMCHVVRCCSPGCNTIQYGLLAKVLVLKAKVRELKYLSHGNIN